MRGQRACPAPERWNFSITSSWVTRHTKAVQYPVGLPGRERGPRKASSLQARSIGPPQLRPPAAERPLCSPPARRAERELWPAASLPPPLKLGFQINSSSLLKTSLDALRPQLWLLGGPAWGKAAGTKPLPRDSGCASHGKAILCRTKVSSSGGKDPGSNPTQPICPRSGSAVHWTVPWLMTLRKVLVCLLCEMGVISQCEVMRGEGGIK